MEEGTEEVAFFFILSVITSKIEKNSSIATTIPTILISTLLGAIFNDILQYINLLGGFLSVIIQFLMPILLYIKNNEYKLSHWKNILYIIFVIFLCSVGWTAGMETVLGLFK